MNRSVCLIFNPASGQGNPDRDLHWIRQQLAPTFALDVHLTTPESSAAELYSPCLENGLLGALLSSGI
jgi:diacylglycerol kinase (ATP)